MLMQKFHMNNSLNYKVVYLFFFSNYHDNSNLLGCFYSQKFRKEKVCFSHSLTFFGILFKKTAFWCKTSSGRQLMRLAGVSGIWWQRVCWFCVIIYALLLGNCVDALITRYTDFKEVRSYLTSFIFSHCFNHRVSHKSSFPCLNGESQA